MSRVTAVVLLVVGVLLLAFGLSATDSIGSAFSRLFTGAPMEKAIWLLTGGIIAFLLGLFSLMRPRRA